MRILPRTLAGEIILIMILVLLAAQLVNLYLLIGERRLTSASHHYSSSVAQFVEELKNLPEFDEGDLPIQVTENRIGLGVYFLSRNNRAYLRADPEVLPDVEERLRNRLKEKGLDFLKASAVRREFGGPPTTDPSSSQPGGKVFHPPKPADPKEPIGGGLEELILSVEIRKGVWLNALLPFYPVGSITWRVAISTGLMLLSAIVVLLLFSYRIERPFRGLVQAADSLGKGRKVAPIPEVGPSDVRFATKTFNKMNQRITRLLETQSNMLRAVGHDLKTPLTSARIRVEEVPEEYGREKLIVLLDEIRDITEEVLNWAKDATGLEEYASVDLDAMLSSVVDNYEDQGKNVRLEESGKFIISCRRTALRRAIRNLIDNALKYGGDAVVSFRILSRHVEISVADSGPGIPEEQLADVMRPFYRLEESRSRDTGGQGLGLAITNSIVLSHGGSLLLKNRKSGGLLSTIRLPL